MKNLIRKPRHNRLAAEFERQRASKLTTEVATRANISPWLAVYDALPNPDPVLRRVSQRIDILHEVKRECHVSACSKSRKAGVLKRLWKIERDDASSQAAETIEKIFNDFRIRSIIREMLDGWGYGYKPLEILWKREGDLLVPFDVVGKPPEWFCFGDKNELRLKKQNLVKSEEIEPYKFLLAQYEASYSNPYGEAQYSLCFWPTTFKKGGIKFWAVFLEKFGMPHALGKLPRNASDTERTKLLADLGNLIQDAAAVVPDDASIELLEMKGGGGKSDLYETHARYHDGEISKVILGHSAAADSTPGRLGNETGAMDVRRDIIEDDSSMVEECFGELIRFIHDLNPTLGAARPRLELYEEEDVDANRADRDFKLMNSGHVRLTKAYFTKRYDFEDEDIEIVEQPAKPPPAEFAAPPGGQDNIDDMLDGITNETMQEQAEELLKPVIDLVKNASSYYEIRNGIVDLYPKLDADKIERTLEKAMLLAELQGAQRDEVTA